MAEGWRDWLAAWEGFRQEVDEYRELDDERGPCSSDARGGQGRWIGLAQMHNGRSLDRFVAGPK